MSGSTKRVGIYIGVSRHAQSSWPAFMPEKGSAAFYGYDLESSSPAFVLWMEEDGKLFAVGSIDRATTDPVGACVLGARYLFTIDLSEFMEYFVYDDSYNPCVSYVPSDIYRKIDNQLKSAVLQAVKDEKEEQRQREAEARAEAERLAEATEDALDSDGEGGSG